MLQEYLHGKNYAFLGPIIHLDSYQILNPVFIVTTVRPPMKATYIRESDFRLLVTFFTCLTIKVISIRECALGITDVNNIVIGYVYHMDSWLGKILDSKITPLSQ